MPQKEVVKQEVSGVPGLGEDTVYITIPLVDIFEQTYPTIQINRHKFEAGKTYLCSRELGAEVERRKVLFDRGQRRLFSNKPDVRAIDNVNRGSNWERGSGGVFAGSPEQSALVADSEKVIVVRD